MGTAKASAAVVFGWGSSGPWVPGGVEGGGVGGRHVPLCDPVTLLLHLTVSRGGLLVHFHSVPGARKVLGNAHGSH